MRNPDVMSCSSSGVTESTRPRRLARIKIPTVSILANPLVWATRLPLASSIRKECLSYIDLKFKLFRGVSEVRDIVS